MFITHHIKQKTHRIALLTAIVLVPGIFSACSSSKVRKPVQVEDLNTKLEVIQPLQTHSHSIVGVRDGVVLVQGKKSLPEQIRKLENEVYSIEDEIYGNRRLGNPGLHGVLKKCLTQLVDREIGGSGKLVSVESEDRPTERDEQIRFGIDENGRVVSLIEEAASDRMARFMEYRRILAERRMDFETRIDVCEQDYRNAVREAVVEDQSLKFGDLYTSDTRSGTRDWRGVSIIKVKKELVQSEMPQGNSAQED